MPTTFLRIDHPHLTPARKQMFVRRLLKLRDILIAAPPEQYDHGLIMEQGEHIQEARGCGTAACAVGHAVLHHRKFPGLQVEIERDEFGYIEGRLSGGEIPNWLYDMAADIDPNLGLDPSTDYYFGPWAWDYIFSVGAYGMPYDQVTKFDAIKRIEDYITKVLGCRLIQISPV